ATPISVQFINGIGRSTFGTAEIELLDGDPVFRGDLRVRVVEGDRPQPGLTVLLFDPKNAPKGRGVTGPDGTYLFEGLDAGPYVAASDKPSTPAAGRAPVTVAPGTTTPVDVELRFRAR
ncbi:MAG: carboxypeptidase-like regulatory domain-containing protein, partial [Planctomycetia bacterium]|nr:carboxypeptidase-like regulatory domain-containing protein [Planctomycetia bacterium]